MGVGIDFHTQIPPTYSLCISNATFLMQQTKLRKLISSEYSFRMDHRTGVEPTLKNQKFSWLQKTPQLPNNYFQLSLCNVYLGILTCLLDQGQRNETKSYIQLCRFVFLVPAGTREPNNFGKVFFLNTRGRSKFYLYLKIFFHFLLLSQRKLKFPFILMIFHTISYDFCTFLVLFTLRKFGKVKIGSGFKNGMWQIRCE